MHRMAEARDISSVPRVVVASPDGALRSALALRPGEAECVLVASPYEAAAELIAAGATAFVIDLRLMGPRHLRLLQIARERGVEMLAVGGIPAGLTAEDLSGIRLLARADLKAAMEKLLQDRQGRYEPAAPPGGKQASAVPASAPVQRPAAPQSDGEKARKKEAPAPEAAARTPAQGLRSILSAEELAALMEDRL